MVLRAAPLALALFGLPACEADDPPEPPSSRCDPVLEQAVQTRDCKIGFFSLAPSVSLGGSWRRGEACTKSALGTKCALQDAGALAVTLEGNRVLLSFEATSDTTVEGFALEGVARVPGARAWLSNGFQSWSQSGAIALGERVSDGELESALGKRADQEVARNGKPLSWSYSVIGGGETHLLLGALDAVRFKPWVEPWREGEEVGLRLACGRAGERVKVSAGEKLDSEPFFVGMGSDLPALLARYAADLPSRHRDAPRAPEAGWNSWYDLWDGVDEKAVRENALLARQALSSRVAPGTKLRIVVDDGWQERWGEWQPNAKFPSGLDGLAEDLRADGFEMGVWLAPLLVGESSVLVGDHPEWFVKGAVYKHLKNGNMRVLDVTYPGAAQHLKSVIANIVSWGYTLLKIDFLFAGTWEGERYEPVTGMQAYGRALTLIREAAGEEVRLVAVGAPDLASLRYADAWRVGGDIALETTDVGWVFITSQARSLAARLPFCLAGACDADPLLLRSLPREEVETGGWVVAFAGGSLFLSDDLTKLPKERAGWGIDQDRATLALGGAPSVPVDFLPDPAPDELTNPILDLLAAKKSSRHVVPRIWRLPDGRSVGLNVTDEVMTIAGVDVPPRAVRPLD